MTEEVIVRNITTGWVLSTATHVEYVMDPAQIAELSERAAGWLLREQAQLPPAWRHDLFEEPVIQVEPVALAIVLGMCTHPENYHGDHDA